MMTQEFVSDLASAIEKLVEKHLPQQIFAVVRESHPFDEYGWHGAPKFLGLSGDRQLAQKTFEEAVKQSHYCKLSRGARTKGYAGGSRYCGNQGSSEIIKIEKLTPDECRNKILYSVLYSVF